MTLSLTADDRTPEGLARFELPAALVAPMLHAFRLGNTMLDTAFYDVGVLTAELLGRGETVTTDPAARDGSLPGRPFAPLDLGAAANPEGCLLLVDPSKPPYVTAIHRVDDFLASPIAAGGDLAITITGVGSSALGSAALAWNAALALSHPVVAIVPGYGVADAFAQGLGGWFGFGVHGWLAEMMQNTLANLAPAVATVGHAMLASVPGHARSAAGAPQFETGSGASDVLHALLTRIDGIRVLVGHSKGALAIENAMRSLPAARTRDLSIVTLGCPIDDSVPAARYVQILGAFDGLGLLNAWGHHANVTIPTHHSTNTAIPFSMPAANLLRAAVSGTLTATPDAATPRIGSPLPMALLEGPRRGVEVPSR